MKFDTLLWEQREHTVCITLNRPQALNSITFEMMRELKVAYEQAETTADIWTIIVTGTGRALCTGADVSLVGATEVDGHPTGVEMQGEPYLANYRQWDVPQEATPPYMT